MNGDNPSVELEDGTQKGGHRGCVGCDGDIRRADEYDYMSYRNYKNLKEKTDLVTAGCKGNHTKDHPFSKLKVKELRDEPRARGKSTKGLQEDLQDKLTF